ncbi:MAG TPA: YihY/virulence factor BrkB family protein [Beijerinckiaceae bacterium]|nr:YihY/virulence factor BrkB family protein [Beijerinckiaceae bacterium]
MDARTSETLPQRTAGIARCVLRETLTDRIMMVAAGLAFFSGFALLPAIAAIGFVYGGLVDQEVLQSQLDRLSGVVPDETIALLTEFLTTIPAGLGFGLSLGLNLLIVLWTVQRTASGIITALNFVYGLDEKRSRVRREAVALGIAFGGLLFLFVALFLIAVAPLFLAAMDDGVGRILDLARWPFLGLLYLLALSLLYRFGPCHDEASWTGIGWGPPVATAIWLSASALFALYLAWGDGWGQFYGTATAVMVLMAWLFISALAVMIGAEVNEQIAERRGAHQGGDLRHTLDRHERLST